MSLSKPYDEAEATRLKLQNVKITVNHLQSEVNKYKKLKAISDQYVREYRAENAELTSLTKNLIANIESLQEKLKVYNPDVTVETSDENLRPVVDPLETVKNLKQLRKLNEELAEKVRDYKAREEAADDVLHLPVYQFTIEQLLEELDDRQPVAADQSVEMFRRVNSELRQNITMYKRIVRSLTYKVNQKTNALTGPAASSKRIQPKSDETLRAYEDEIGRLKIEIAEHKLIIDELSHECSRWRKAQLSFSHKSSADLGAEEDDLLFLSRTEELTHRVISSQARMKYRDLEAQVQSLSEQVTAQDDRMKTLTRNLARAEKERDEARGIVKSMQGEGREPSAYKSNVISIRDSGLEGASSAASLRALGDKYDHHVPSLRQVPLSSSLTSIARSPGIMSSGASLGTTQSSLPPAHHSDSMIQLRTRGAQPAQPTQYSAPQPSYSAQQRQFMPSKNYGPMMPGPMKPGPSSMPPPGRTPDRETLDCPRCNRKFDGSRADAFLAHVDTCMT